MSGGRTGTDPSVLVSKDFRISNDMNESLPGVQSIEIKSIREMDGGLFFIVSTNFMISDSCPSTTIFTPASPILRTNPVSKRDSARLYTNGLKPTPWTIPAT